MAKKAVIMNVVCDGTTYIASYASGKVVAASCADMPKTVKAWLEKHVEPHTEVLEDSAVNSSNEEIKAEETANMKGESEMKNEVMKNEVMVPAVETKKGNPAGSYADIPVNPDDVREIISEGVQAAAFAGAATLRMFMCFGLLLSWIYRKGKELFLEGLAWAAWFMGVCVNAVESFFDAVFTGYEELKKYYVAVKEYALDLLTDVRNFAAPYFWVFADKAVNAWEFRREVISEM